MKNGILAVYENHRQDARYTEQKDTMPTVVAHYGTGGNNQPLVVREQKPKALYCMATGQTNAEITDGRIGVTLTTVAEKPIVILDRAAYNQGINAKYDFCAQVGGAAPTVIAKGPGAVCCPKLSDRSAQEITKVSETNMSKKGK